MSLERPAEDRVLYRKKLEREEEPEGEDLLMPRQNLGSCSELTEDDQQLEGLSFRFIFTVSSPH